jgi:hypothetical protein
MTFDRVLAAVPRRPLTLGKSAKSLGAQILAFLGFLLFGGLAGWQIAENLPDLINDTTIGANAAPVAGSWGGWNCTIHRHVLASCTVELHWPDAAPGPAAGAAPGGGKGAVRPVAAPAGGQQLYRAVPMMFFGSPDRNAPLSVLRDPANPTRISSTLGQSYLTDRWITLGVIGGILIALALACLVGMIKGRRLQTARRQLAAQPNPTVVTLTKVQRAKGVATWTFSWSALGRQFQARDNLLKPDTEPLLLDPRSGAALALTDAGGRAMLVNARATNLQLTDAERAALLGAAQQVQPPPAHAAAPAAHR